MENNIPTLYILELDSSAVKSTKILAILCSFAQKSCIRVAMVNISHDASQVTLRSVLI